MSIVFDEPEVSSNEFTVRFGGDQHEIRADTLISALTNLSIIAQEINTELRTPAKIDVKIQALERGSFLVHLSLVADTAKNLFGKDVIDIGSKIIGSTVGILSIKKLLGKGKPKSIKNEDRRVKIESEKGNIVIVGDLTFNLYNKNQAVHDAISHTFQSLREDGTVTDLEIIDKKKNSLFQAKRAEFPDLAIKSEILEEGKKIINEVATLHIFKVVFETKFKWEFFYAGNRISASIGDVAFFKLIDGGERFAKGDSLVVDLEIHQLFDASVNTFVNSSYHIKRVIKHIPRGEQPELDLG